MWRRCSPASTAAKSMLGRTPPDQGTPYRVESGSFHALTSTVRVPRSSITRTVVPLASGSGDHAMNDSVPPRILTSTSPGPAVPRVATVMTPTQPMAEVFATTPSHSLPCAGAETSTLAPQTERREDGTWRAGGRNLGAG